MDSLTRKQFRVLHREFLFRIVDRELLSAYSQGDANRLLVQFVSLLIFLSMLFAAPTIAFGPHLTPQARLTFALTIEHLLIATTMLAVGLLGVLSWNTLFPDRLDVHVLAPLPVRPRTVFLAKIAGAATGLGITVGALHLLSGALWPLLLNTPMPGLEAAGSLRNLPRTLAAYWIAMAGGGTFIFCALIAVQGLAAYLLPRRYFLRASPLLQLIAFCVIVGGFSLQPLLVGPATLAAVQQPGWLSWSPSYWFLGLMQQIQGSTLLAPLAWRAWWGLGLAVCAMTAAYALSYFRTFRRIAEEPAIAPGSRHARWLPRFGNARQTAVVRFSIRTLLRSPQHRLILSFYVGMGFTFAFFLLRTPVGRGLSAGFAPDSWRAMSVPLIVANVLMLFFVVMGTRITGALPLDLRANWIFRIAPVHGGPQYLAARRRSLLVLSVVPVWAISAVVFLTLWPWRPAMAHLVVLALLGLVLVEVCLHGVQKIPFTCAYLPGKTNLHVTFWVCMLVLFPLIAMGAAYERRAFEDLTSYAGILAVLFGIWIGARWWNGQVASSNRAQPQYEEVQPDRMASLDVWDAVSLRTPKPENGHH